MMYNKVTKGYNCDFEWLEIISKYDTIQPLVSYYKWYSTTLYIACILLNNITQSYLA